MFVKETDGLGRIEVTTIPMPDFAKNLSATYTYSGTVLVFYETDGDPAEKGFINIAVVNDDGSAFRTIFSDVISVHEKANGIRHMPFQDNKRILLGDYVLECSPDIDTCEKVELVPVEYPWDLINDVNTMKHWSEIIIAPDNEHISWTSLRTDIGAANGLGKLKRLHDKYIIENPQIISGLTYFEEDKAHPGYIIPLTVHGGEVKQFVRGGTAISLVGAGKRATADSVMEDLITGEVTAITNTPGYNETTIFSPDERLGIVMSPRGSKKTDFAIFGLLPRPYGIIATSGLTMPMYMYSVAGVRSFRKGNIGPVLIEIERSIHEQDYQGVLLHDPEEEWVYVSPISWHPDGKKAMWMEMLRGSWTADGGRKLRVRKVILHDYQPGETVPIQKTPDDIPYAITDENWKLMIPGLGKGLTGKIAGKHSGYIDHQRKSLGSSYEGVAETQYINFSDDGKTFYNGYEKIQHSFSAENIYEADLEMTGEHQGEMKLRVTFSQMTFKIPPRLLFEEAPDGKPKSYGYAVYDGVRLNIEDMVE